MLLDCYFVHDFSLLLQIIRLKPCYTPAINLTQAFYRKGESASSYNF